MIKRKPKLGNPKSKIKLPKSKSLKKACDDLWADIIKAKAGYKSELSGKEGKQIGGNSVLNAHHIAGKPNYRLRYEFENGICITNGEHFFGIHHAGHEFKYREWIKQVRGQDIYERMEALGHSAGNTKLAMVEIFLRQELKRIQNEIEV